MGKQTFFVEAHKLVKNFCVLSIQQSFCVAPNENLCNSIKKLFRLKNINSINEFLSVTIYTFFMI